MSEDQLASLQDAHFPLKKAEVMANAVDHEIDDLCVEEMAAALDDDRTYENVAEIRSDLEMYRNVSSAQDNAPVRPR